MWTTIKNFFLSIKYRYQNYIHLKRYQQWLTYIFNAPHDDAMREIVRMRWVLKDMPDEFYDSLNELEAAVKRIEEMRKVLNENTNTVD